MNDQWRTVRAIGINARRVERSGSQPGVADQPDLDTAKRDRCTIDADLIRTGSLIPDADLVLGCIVGAEETHIVSVAR